MRPPSGGRDHPPPDMTFIHGYLLGGLLLAGVPVLLHLLLRQKPKRLDFPAFRFLKARQRTNQRRLQLQHLLLLALRVLVVALMCMALARPLLSSGPVVAAARRPVAAVLLFDTSASMEYTVGGVTRLDDARKRARELLDELEPGSRVAVVDAADDATAVLLPVAEARVRLEAVRIQPGAGPLNLAVERSLRLLDQQPGGEADPSRVLYVFTDRARGAWEATGPRPKVPDEVSVAWVDVGVDTPRDLGIERVEVIPPVVPPGGRLEVRVTVRGTPGGHENELSCAIDNDPEGGRVPDRRPVQLEKGVTGDVLLFERTAPMLPGGTVGDVPFQLTVRLGTRDAMPFNNTRHATFLVRGSRKLLTLVDRLDPARTRIWEAAHAATRSFACDVRTFDDAAKLSPKELSGYAVIALFETPAVPADWWPRLAAHVRGGGGLAIVPGGEEVEAGREAFNKAALDARLLPAPLDRLLTAPAGKPTVWARFSGAHPLMAPFVAWSRGVDPDFARDDLRPFARRYWKLGALAKGGLAVTAYADGNPALAERGLERGRVVLFTGPLDFRYLDARRTVQWNNYWTDSSFGLVLIDQVCRYRGEVTIPEMNFICGTLPVPGATAAADPPLTVSGPGLAGPERNLKPPGSDGRPGGAAAVAELRRARRPVAASGRVQSRRRRSRGRPGSDTRRRAGGGVRQGHRGSPRRRDEPARRPRRQPAVDARPGAVPDVTAARRADRREPVRQPLLPPRQSAAGAARAEGHAVTAVFDPIWPWSYLWAVLVQVPGPVQALALFAALAALAVPLLAVTRPRGWPLRATLIGIAVCLAQLLRHTWPVVAAEVAPGRSAVCLSRRWVPTSPWWCCCSGRRCW
ncbi:MAG: BatA domain-containing protein [Gemmataceae bacterium]